MHESISALVDNEANDLDLPRLLKELSNSTNKQQLETSEQLESTWHLNKKWHSFHLVSNVLRGELPKGTALKFSQLDISAKVAAQLEATKEAEESSLKSQWLKTSALAASVALVVLAAAQVYSLLPSGELSQPVANPLANKAISPAATLASQTNNQPAAQAVTWVGACQPSKLKNLAKPPYLAQASSLPNQPCQGLAFTPFNSAVSKVQYTPVSAP